MPKFSNVRLIIAEFWFISPANGAESRFSKRSNGGVLYCDLLIKVFRDPKTFSFFSSLIVAFLSAFVNFGTATATDGVLVLVKILLVK